MGINQATLTGNLTRDSELKFTQSGTPVLSFGIATSERTRNQQTGEWEDRASFVNCVVWGKRGQSLQPHLTKGVKVAVRGPLRSHSWPDKADPRKRHYRLELVVHDLDLMDYHGNANARAEARPADATAPTPPTPEQAAGDFYDEDISF